MTSKLLHKFKDPAYRSAFVASQINIGIPFQIRSMLRGKGKTQGWLCEKTGMRQPRISSLMTPGKTRPNIETLRRIAEAFDCGLAVRFVPFGELVHWSESFDPETFNVPDFETERKAVEHGSEAVAGWRAAVTRDLVGRSPLSRLDVFPRIDLLHPEDQAQPPHTIQPSVASQTAAQAACIHLVPTARRNFPSMSVPTPSQSNRLSE